MSKNIALIGMPGCGKTSIGEILSKKLNMPFVDTDEVVESYGMSIEELFEVSEESFRFVETMAIKEVATLNNCVISTGGGIVTIEENIEHLRCNSVIFFLDRNIERIVKDVEAEKNTRPLLKDDISNLYFLFDKRYDLYKKYADIVIENNGSIYKVCDEIANKFKELPNE